jgi:hypothetical protein
MVEAGDFIPCSKEALCIKIVDDGDARRWGRGTAGNH